LRTAALVAGTSGMLAACDGSNAATPAPPISVRPTTMWLSDEPFGPAKQQVDTAWIDFARGTSGQPVPIIWLPLAELAARMAGALAAGQGPDIVVLSAAQAAEELARRTIRPLPWPESFSLRRQQLVPLAAATTLFDTTPVGVPFALLPYFYFWQRTALSAARLEKPPETWEEALVAAALLQKTPPSGGLVAPDVGEFHALVHSAGGNQVTRGRSAFAGEEGAQALQFLLDRRRYETNTRPDSNGGWYGTLDGDVAHAGINGPARVGAPLRMGNQKYRVSDMSRSTQTVSTRVLMLSATNRAGTPEAFWPVARWLTAPDHWQQWLAAPGWLRSVDDAPVKVSAETPPISLALWYLAKHGVLAAEFPGSDAFGAAQWPPLQEAIAGRKTISEALRTSAAACDAVLAARGYQGSTA
jgi:ABC-type glycerol-3-phosphate transport system substrate-binding protein